MQPIPLSGRLAEVSNDTSELEWFKVVGARCGMRGVRVGEASHPGPPDHDEWTAQGSAIDALEADLTPPVPSTIQASVGGVMRRM